MPFLTPPHAPPGHEGEASTVLSVLGTYESLWMLGFVLPGVLAGGFLVLELIAPDNWPFPNPRPALACDPSQLQPGAAVTLRMRTPHGGELRVLTPAGLSLVIVPYLRKGREAEGQGFRYTRRLVLRTDTLAGFT